MFIKMLEIYIYFSNKTVLQSAMVFLLLVGHLYNIGNDGWTSNFIFYITIIQLTRRAISDTR